MTQNYYGSLCTKMYEILHSEAPHDELEFYLSYAQKGMSILEPLCGNGRFLVPFLDREYNISGIDSFAEILAKLREKAPDAKVFQEDISKFESTDKFDDIFISYLISVKTYSSFSKDIAVDGECEMFLFECKADL